MKTMKISNLSTGKILVSEPFISGLDFQRSVVLLVDYGEDGAFGVVLNKPVSYSLHHIMFGTEFKDIYPYKGGPVEKNLLFFIHALGDQIEGSASIDGQLYWGGNYHQVRELLKNNVLHENNIWFFMGYAGWSAKQLEREVDEGVWVVAETPLLELMQVDRKQMWRDAVSALGNPYNHWVNFPLHPIYN